jgi:hypothetical protein
MVPEEGVDRLSLRPSRAAASAAGLGADGLLCVALFLPIRSAPLASSTPSIRTKLNEKGQGNFPWPLEIAWCRRRGSNPHEVALTGF